MFSVAYVFDPNEIWETHICVSCAAATAPERRARIIRHAADCERLAVIYDADAASDDLQLTPGAEDAADTVRQLAEHLREFADARFIPVADDDHSGGGYIPEHRAGAS